MSTPHRERPKSWVRRFALAAPNLGFTTGLVICTGALILTYIGFSWYDTWRGVGVQLAAIALCSVGFDFGNHGPGKWRANVLAVPSGLAVILCGGMLLTELLAPIWDIVAPGCQSCS